MFLASVFDSLVKFVRTACVDCVETLLHVYWELLVSAWLRVKCLQKMLLVL